MTVAVRLWRGLTLALSGWPLRPEARERRKMNDALAARRSERSHRPLERVVRAHAPAPNRRTVRYPLSSCLGPRTQGTYDESRRGPRLHPSLPAERRTIRLTPRDTTKRQYPRDRCC